VDNSNAENHCTIYAIGESRGFGRGVGRHSDGNLA